MTEADVEQWRAEIETKRERQHYFWDLQRAATRAAQRAPAVVKKPKKARKPDRERKVRVARGPIPCRGGCGRIVRPAHASIEDFPGTITDYSAGACASCSTGGQKRFATPAACVQCGVGLYKGHAPRELRPPGARRHMGRGLCSACYQGAER